MLTFSVCSNDILQRESSLTGGGDPHSPKVGEKLYVEWPCEGDGGQRREIWFTVVVQQIRERKSRFQYLLQFEDGAEVWSSFKHVKWQHCSRAASHESQDALLHSTHQDPKASASPDGAEDHDVSGFVHIFEISDALLHFCDDLHKRREELGDKTRGDAAYGEPLHGGLVSVVIRRDALPAGDREHYRQLHQRCIEEIPVAWPQWLRQAAGPRARARPSQDLRLLQYSEGANFRAHVDSGWACQALIYLNEDFCGGWTLFPNLEARYRPLRGRVLMWRSVCVGHKPATPGSHADHPALHVAGAVSDGVKKVVSLHFVLA